MKLLIVTNSQPVPYSVRRLVEEASAFFSQVTIAQTNQLLVKLDTGNFGIYVQDTPINEFDAFIFKSSRKTTALFFNEFFKLFFLKVNQAKVLNGNIYHQYSFLTKTIQLALLAQNNIPIPETFLGKQIAQLALPTVAKDSFDNNGYGVYRAETEEELMTLRQQMGDYAFTTQKLIEKEADYRVIVLNNQVMGAMKKQILGDQFTSNIHRGGKPQPVPPEIRNILDPVAIKAATSLKMELAGVDIILDENNQPYVIEVNDTPGFEGFEKVNQVNMAKEILEHLAHKVSGDHT